MTKGDSKEHLYHTDQLYYFVQGFDEHIDEFPWSNNITKEKKYWSYDERCKEKGTSLRNKKNAFISREAVRRILLHYSVPIRFAKCQ